jgi:tetrahydromethanopterin S-methyltransferase subunit F
MDEEIERLPESFRAVLVLSVLEGKSGAEIAAQLGIRPGTVSSRRTRARQRLQRRLSRRGIELSALLAAVAVAENAGQAGMPAVIASITVRFGLLVAAGGPAAGVIPARIAKLAAGVIRAMYLTKAKIATTILLTVCLLAGSAGLITHQVLAGKPAMPQTGTKERGRSSNQLVARQEKAKTGGKPSTEQAPGAFTFSGQVLDPDGRPIPGAIVAKNEAAPAPQPRPIDGRIHIRAVADGQGHYRITGLPRGASFLAAEGPAGKPYLISAREVQAEPGLEPITLDFSLERGVWIDVRVTEKLTGKPVRCRIQFFAFGDNSFLRCHKG